MNTNKIPFQLEIPKRSHTCSSKGETFVPGAEYYSIVLDGDAGLLQRRDFCTGCWENSAKKEWLPEARSNWKSVVPKKAEVPKKVEKNEEHVLELLKEALNAEGSEAQAEAFLLALYLARKKQIYLRQQLKDANGELISLYEVAATEEMLCVRRCALSALQMDSIQKRLMDQLNG